MLFYVRGRHFDFLELDSLSARSLVGIRTTQPLSAAISSGINCAGDPGSGHAALAHTGIVTPCRSRMLDRGSDRTRNLRSR